MSKRITRRNMLKSSILAGSGVLTIVGGGFRATATVANEKLNVALIGAGGRGAANLQGVRGENIVALCDVDQRRAADTFNAYPDTKKYADYRKMLDEMESQIDAVVVSTPNHVHVPASVTAMRMGKHAYCEKPLAHSVFEARVAAQVAAEKNVATQMGTQIHAGGNYRRVVELVQGGAIGPVRECHVWISGGKGGYTRPTDTPAVPDGLDWDLWLGPAPQRPYNPCYVPHDWHYWWDFGGGRLGNMGCHFMDLPFWALKLRHPTAIETEGPPPLPQSTPQRMTIRYEFPARHGLPPVKMTWRHGDPPPILKARGVPGWGSGVLFVGTEGRMLLADYNRRSLLPEPEFADFQPPEATIPDSIGHHQEWITACKTGSPTTCNFDYSGALTETVLLGNVAFRLGRRIEWDAVGLKVVDCPQAEPLLRRDYRPGWTC